MFNAGLLAMLLHLLRWKKILEPYPPGEMGVYRVSSRVNSPDAGDGQLIPPLVTLSD